MTTIDIEAIQREFDRIIQSFGTDSARLISEEFIQENSFILNSSGGGTGNNSGLEKVFLTVTTFQDQNDGNASNGLSLRDAILQAQSDPGKEYVINLPAGLYELSIQGNEDFRFQETSSPNVGLFDNLVTRTGDLDIQTRVTIIGENPQTTIIDASNLEDRIFDVRAGGFLTLNGVTLQNGVARGTFPESAESPKDADSFLGGGIRIDAQGTAIINETIIQGNRSQWDRETSPANVNGGGIANRGLLEINNSLIANNIADINGGGIFNSGTLSIAGSSIVNNSATANIFFVDQVEGGGGIINDQQGSLIIRNSTISGNTTSLSGNTSDFFPNGAGGGGILSLGSQLVVINSTIADNSAPLGSGILVSAVENIETPSRALLQNSIVARNNGSADIDGFFEPTSSFNLIGNGNGILFDGVRNNLAGDIVNPLDPQLSTLQNNGSLTPTYSLLPNSPAINAGSNQIAAEVGASDQRGLSRIMNGNVDMGSVEFVGNETLTSPIYRFRNTEVSGTYLFVNDNERQEILRNFPQFKEEGFAFNVAMEAGDSLIPIYRFQNTSIMGTYLYATEGERQQINQNNSNFREEGIAFYVFGAEANKSDSIYRFQNNDMLGTYLFVTEGERQNINQNFPNFMEEGIAFEARY